MDTRTIQHYIHIFHYDTKYIGACSYVHPFLNVGSYIATRKSSDMHIFHIHV